MVRVEALLGSIADARRDTEDLVEEAGGEGALHVIDEACERIRAFLRRETYVDSRKAKRLAREGRAAAWEAVARACDQRIERLQQEADQLRDRAGEARGHAREAEKEYGFLGFFVSAIVLWILFFSVLMPPPRGKVSDLMVVVVVAVVAATWAVTTYGLRTYKRAQWLREAERYDTQHVKLRGTINYTLALRDDATDRARGLGGEEE